MANIIRHLLIHGYTPAVDDAGNQYLERPDTDDICHHCGQKMIVAYIGGGALPVTIPAHGDHPKDSYKYDGCPACEAATSRQYPAKFAHARNRYE